MKEERYFYCPGAADTDTLPAQEAQHATRVLRLSEGDEIVLIDGCGAFHRAEITLATSKICQYRIVETQPQPRPWPHRITIALAPTKMMERTEWAAEKMTEIGIDALALLDCRFSERKVVKTDRIDKILVSAVKQSRKAWMPELTPMTPFRQYVDSQTAGLRCIAHCYEEVPRVPLTEVLRSANQYTDAAAAAKHDTATPILVMIGPEGDFSIDEVRYAVAAGFVSVSLGTSRLRTETAAVVAAEIAQLFSQVDNSTI